MAKKLLTDTDICLKCVDENEIISDTGEVYLKRIKDADLDCPEEMFEEILRNIEICEQVLFMSIKQKTILNETRVRFDAKNGVAEMQEKIFASKLSKDCRDYLRYASQPGYECLKVNKFFQHMVEFDAERLCKVAVHGKNTKMVCYFDIIVLMDEKPRHDPKSTEMLKNKKTSRKQAASRYKNVNEKSENIHGNEKTAAKDKKVNEKSKNLDKVVVSVILTGRRYVNALDIFRQIIYSKILNATYFYLLVYHIGPLVEKQEIVLYEYVIPQEIQKALKSTNETNGIVKQEPDYDKPMFIPFTVSQTVHKSAFLHAENSDVNEIEGLCDFDVSQLESEFRKVKDHNVYQASAMREYFRYLVYDTPGVKDHKKDAKARYERYINKKRQKKERKKKDKADKLVESETDEGINIDFIENKDNENAADSKIGDCGSSVHVTEDTYRQLESISLDK